MSWVTEILDMAKSVNQGIAVDVYPHGAILRCKACLYMELASVDDCGLYFAQGWPWHCGQHMVAEKRVPRKAYKCTIVGWPEFEMIWPGETRGKALARCWYDGQDAGWDIPWTDYRAVRAPEFDELARKTEGKLPWCIGWRDVDGAWGCLDSTGKRPLPIPIS